GIRTDRITMKRCLWLYAPLIAQHLAGILLCTLLVPYMQLILITPLLNLPVIIATVVLLIRMKCPVIDRIFGWLTVIAGVINMILAMSGLAYIAFTLMLFWFIAVAGIQTGISITIQIRNYTADNSRNRIMICLLLTLLMPLAWLVIIGSMIYWTAGLYSQQDMLLHILELKFIPEEKLLQISAIDLITAVVVAMFLRFIIATIRHLISIIYGEKAEMGLIPTFLTLGNYLAWGCYVIFLLILFNVQPNSILVVLGGMSMGVGFGLKEIVENFISGVILLAGKQLRPGDIIEFNGIWGKVRKVSVRATVVDTDDNAVITFPNSQVLSKDFRNWTLNRSIIREEINIGVAYGSDLKEVYRLLDEVLNNNHKVMKRPQWDILLSNFDDSQLTLTLRVWMNVLHRHHLGSELRLAIYNTFAANGIVIPFPQMDVHVGLPPPQQPFPAGL
ncbi:MAG: mechanosensitive ion channel, partial [Victivallales bacterium]|nr:mechanosensitive ion channel [Victivallales bacterium]